MSGLLSKDTLVSSLLLTSHQMADCSYPPRLTALSGYGTCAMESQSFWLRIILWSSIVPVTSPPFSALMGGVSPLPIVTGWCGYGMYVQASWWEGCWRIWTTCMVLYSRQMGRVWWVGVRIRPWNIGILVLCAPPDSMQDYKRQMICTDTCLEWRNRLSLSENSLGTRFVCSIPFSLGFHVTHFYPSFHSAERCLLPCHLAWWQMGCVWLKRSKCPHLGHPQCDDAMCPRQW